MAIVLQEKIVAAFVARLEDTLNSYIDEVNNDVVDGHLIEYPAQIMDFIPPLSMMTQFPIVGVKDGPVELEDDTGWGATGVCIVHLVVFDQHAEQQALVRRLRRYAQALTRCAIAGRTIDDGWGVRLLRVDPGPTLGSDSPQTFMSTIAITIEVRTEQDTP